MTPKDKLGREVKVGDYIAYGHALDRSAALRVGKILRLTPPSTEPRDWHYSDRLWRGNVIGIDDDGWKAEDNFTKPPKLLSRVGTLNYPNRWVRISPGDMPEEYRRLLDTFADEWWKKNIDNSNLQP